MDSNPKDFSDLKDSLYLKAERRWSLSVLCNVVALLGATLALGVPETAGLGLLLSMGVLFLPAVSVVLRELAAFPSERADVVRQLILFSDSLGHEIPDGEQARVRKWVPRARLAKAPYEAPYYWSKRPPGASRLADNLAESAFFTESIAEGATTILALGAAVAFLMAVAIIFLAVSIQSNATSHLVKGAIAAIAFVVTGDWGVTAWRFSRLRSASEHVYEAACSLREKPEVTLPEVLPALQEYESARLQAPPLPRWLHIKKMKELNADYRSSHGGGSGASTS